MVVNEGPVYGPSYAEMRNPQVLAPDFLKQAAALRIGDPFHQDKLFNIHWFDCSGVVSAFLVPPAVTGMEANLVVMDGSRFPSGSMKVGPAYAMLMEQELRQGIRPGTSTVIAPSTGNFGIGAAWVARVKGYNARVVMPEGMSKERYELIEALGASTDLTPGSEADVNVTLQQTRDRYAAREDCVVLGQFSDLANYRFHRHVTAEAVRKAVQGFGLAGVDLFVSAPGSAGTLAAGEGLRDTYPGMLIGAVEPEECATLSEGTEGSHVIEGIGDQMVTLIHNIQATDYVVRVAGEQTIQGTAVFSASVSDIATTFDISINDAYSLQNRFGPSGICNLIGSMHLSAVPGLRKGQTVVTVATDSNDRYQSVLDRLSNKLKREPDHEDFVSWWSEIQNRNPEMQVMDIRKHDHRLRLHAMKQRTWQRYGFSRDFIDSMQSQEFWDKQYQQVGQLDSDWLQLRHGPGCRI